MSLLAFVLLACLGLAAAAAHAQPSQSLPILLDLAGRPGVPPGVSGQVLVQVPINPPPPAASPAPPSTDVLRGPPGNVLQGPPGNPLTGAPLSQPPPPTSP
jgi:hypothetical protein